MNDIYYVIIGVKVKKDINGKDVMFVFNDDPRVTFYEDQSFGEWLFNQDVLKHGDFDQVNTTKNRIPVDIAFSMKDAHFMVKKMKNLFEYFIIQKHSKSGDGYIVE